MRMFFFEGGLCVRESIQHVHAFHCLHPAYTQTCLCESRRKKHQLHLSSACRAVVACVRVCVHVCVRVCVGVFILSDELTRLRMLLGAWVLTKRSMTWSVRELWPWLLTSASTTARCWTQTSVRITWCCCPATVLTTKNQVRALINSRRAQRFLMMWMAFWECVRVKYIFFILFTTCVVTDGYCSFDWSINSFSKSGGDPEAAGRKRCVKQTHWLTG